MADTVITPVAAPVAAPTTMKDELTALFGKEEKAEKDPASEPVLGEPSSSPPDSLPTGEVAKPEPTLEEQIAEIAKETPAEEAAKSALTPEQTQILAAVPDTTTLTQLQETVNGFQNFSNAFAGGDFETVEQMFQAWNPTALEGFMEYIYQTKLVKPGDKSEWLLRWIDEKQGNGNVSAATRSLEARLNKLQQQLEQKQVSEQTVAQQRANQEAGKKFDSHLEGLFDRVKFSPADRKWVRHDVIDRVKADPKVLAAVRAGNFTAVNPLWAAAVTEYSKKDKEASETVGAKLKIQEARKLPVGNAGGSESTAPTDMAGAKTAAEREQVMRNQLADVFKRAK